MDHLNSTKVVTDEAGEVVVNYTYRAFGEQLRRLDKSNAPTEDLGKYSYGGKELDGDINLYYFNARFYDASTGRFINVDPVQDGTNWYVYVSNNPLSFVDPTGLREVVGTDTNNDLIMNRDYKPEKAVVRIERPTDGYRIGFDAKRTVDVTMENGQTMRTGNDDRVSANKMEPDANPYSVPGITLPDGVYGFTTDGLTLQKDGTANSLSYDNVLRYQTSDQSIPAGTRTEINNGMYLNHANQYAGKSGEGWKYGSYSSGCISQRGGQAGQDTFINQLAGLAPGGVKIIIESRVHAKRGVK